ncbi:MalY/PatB family protein [Enterocloster lavalensis]|uniref:MalY/PatB family protein n=1 Tax=Enterocloster lavalensis TaxID=460384 RepID=UPI0023F0DBFA|nr:PatB family C-S lyase [Enterocloster lavalensis]
MGMHSKFDRSRDTSKGNLRRYDPAMVAKDKFSLWIADTDFLCPEEVIQDLRDKIEERTFGYTYRDGAFERAAAGWQSRRFGWDVDAQWVGYSAGVIAGIGYVLRTFTQIGDKVLIQKPVYQKFAELVENNGRRVENSPLKLAGGVYEIDFDDLERRLRDPLVTMMILCNPHNPTGRCFTEEELLRIGRLCVQNRVLIVSDEIHQDIVYSGHQHVNIACLDQVIGDQTITFINPSKTFNLPGLYTAAWIAANPAIREKLDWAFHCANADCRNTLGVTAFVSAYTRGDRYADEMTEYLAQTRRFMGEYLRENLPEVKLIDPQSTYLYWLDFRGLGYGSQSELETFLYEKAGIYLNSGLRYGEEGKGFMRFNAASPHQTIRAALKALGAAARTDWTERM